MRPQISTAPNSKAAAEARCAAMQLTPQEWAYFAGIIDGEGCINIHARGKEKQGYRTLVYSLVLAVTNTNQPLMLWVHAKLGGYLYRIKRATSNTGCTYWQWTASARHAAAILDQIRPYLIAKPKQAEVAIAFQKSVEAAKHRPQGRRGRVRGRPPLSEEELASRESFYQQLRAIRQADKIPVSY